MDTMELKHVCKFCKKRFPCGRSLGGHIRSHLIKNSKNSRDALNDEPEMSKSGSKPGYELRENPKKTDKAADLLNSSPSSWSIESDNEHLSDPSHQKRNPGRRSCVLGGNNSNSSVSEVVEAEQEEVDIAMCLLKLSRDVGNETVFGATDKTNTNRMSKNLEFAASGHLQYRSKMEEFEVSANGFASNDQRCKPSESRNSISGASNNAGKSKKVESVPSGHLQNGLKMKGQQVSGNVFPSNDQNNSQSKRKVSETYSNKNLSKMKEFEVYKDGSTLNDQKSNNQGLGFDETTMVLELLGNKSNNKRSKFECTTCDKVFHSYQALGGHRASHKKLLGVKSSPVPKLDDIANDHDQEQIIADIGIRSSSSSSPPISQKVVQKYECPICFRVFPSGQALGGHKRSHLLATANNNDNKERSLVEESSSTEIRDMLDLNLPPAPAEEETATTTTTTTITTSSSSNSLVELIKPYWWVESS